MTLKKHILSRVTRDNSSWVEQNDYDLENYEEISEVEAYAEAENDTEQTKGTEYEDEI